MNPWRWVDPRIAAVRVADVQAYFLHQGWKLVPNPNPNLLRFEALTDGSGPPFFQMVPASETFADYRQCLAELITTLSEIEDRHPIAVLEAILNQASQDGTPVPNGDKRTAKVKSIRK
jgi:hypothetical protein